MPDSTPKSPPTPTEIRDKIDARLPNDTYASMTPNEFAKRKKVGEDEILLNHPSGKKFVLKVREIDG